LGKKAYIIRRLFHMALTLYIIITITFFMFRLMPGDPVSMLITGDLGEEAREMIKRSWGLDKSLWEQYLLYFKNICQGEFGVSFYYKLSVWEVLRPRMVNTLILMGTSMALSVVIAIIVGAIVGWRRNTRFEKAGVFFFLSLRSIPIFWMGILLLMVFSYWLRLFPGGGMHSTGFMAVGFFPQYLNLDFLKHLALPFLCSFLYNIGDPLMIMRSSMLEIKEEDFLTILEAKGLSQASVIAQCARNAILPVITYTGVLVGYAFSGQVLLETVFSWPGIGSEIVSAVFLRDYPVAQASFVLMALVVVIMNFIIDLSYGFLDPRIVYK
jgi:peptide/nickel transport system permease protein